MVANTGAEDPDRLRRVAEVNRFPVSTDFESYDFLRGEEMKDPSRYRIHFNNMGFRDSSDRRVPKPANTFRIIALGTYQTFGHGLGNDETFPARLERLLNQRFRGSPRVEVWNGGRHAGTAIIALARIRNEIYRYSPDLVLIDYGMVDPVVLGDDLFLHHAQLPEHGVLSIFRGPLAWLNKYLGQPQLLQRMTSKIVSLSKSSNVARFKHVMALILADLAKHHVPAVVINSTMSRVPDAEMAAVTKPYPGASFFSLRVWFRENPPLGEELRAFRSQPNWTEEFGENAATDVKRFPFEYHLDYFQYNSRGMLHFAEGLAELIEPIIGHK